jgi:hypothetical protein
MMTIQTQRRLRQFHFYLGMFFAPAIIFFALSGAAQTFRLQEEKGWGGPPPAWLVWVAAVHKDQGPPRPKRARPVVAEAPRPVIDPAVAAAAKASAALADPFAPAQKAAKPRSRLPMQIFTVVMGLGLTFSALLGILVALNNKAMRRLSIIMLAAGALVPILLIG